MAADRALEADDWAARFAGGAHLAEALAEVAELLRPAALVDVLRVGHLRQGRRGAVRISRKERIFMFYCLHLLLVGHLRQS